MNGRERLLGTLFPESTPPLSCTRLPGYVSSRHLEQMTHCGLSPSFLPSFQMGLGFMQFGFVAIYLSESFIRGFMTAAGLQILISVLKYIFGLTIPSYTGPGSIVFVSPETPFGGGTGWEQSSHSQEVVNWSS